MQTFASGRGGLSVQFLVLTVFLVLGYYLGRPIYWTLESRLQDVMHSPGQHGRGVVEQGDTCLVRNRVLTNRSI